MKKALPYCIVSTIALVIFVFLSLLMNFSLSNTWQATFALLFILGPLWVYAWKESPTIKYKHALLYVLIRFCLICLVVGYILSVILFFMGIIK